MTLYVDSESRIKDVDSTTDSALTPLEVTDGTFDGWSIAKICCYKVAVKNGAVTMFTPYVDSRLIEHIDQLGKQVEKVTPYTETKQAYIGDTSIIFTGVPNGTLTVYFPYVYMVDRSADRIIVSFEALEEVTDVTISIL